MPLEELPTISVLFDGTNYFSLNNRRLYVLKALHQLGVLDKVVVRLKSPPDSRRMTGKYTAAKCSLTSTLMRERAPGCAQGDDGDEVPLDADSGESDVEVDATNDAMPSPPPLVAVGNAPPQLSRCKLSAEPHREGKGGVTQDPRVAEGQQDRPHQPSSKTNKKRGTKRKNGADDDTKTGGASQEVKRRGHNLLAACEERSSSSEDGEDRRQKSGATTRQKKRPTNAEMKLSAFALLGKLDNSA